MGGWDIFCAICGGPTSWTPEDQEEIDEHPEDVQRSYAILQHEDIEWLNKFRCIGENSDSASIDKVFISGPVESSDYGGCELQPPDERAFNADGLSNFISVYSWGGRDQEPLVFPYHDICLHTILERVISRMSGSSESVDKDVVYRALKEFGTSSSENFAAHLDRLDYGEQMEELHGQYWYINPGAESYMVNPVTIPALQEYYSQLPRLESSPEETPSAATAATSDVFSRLPLELLQHITRYIPVENINTLKTVSPSVAAFTTTNSFWRERVLQDMPWLYDLPETKNMGLDWARIYKELFLKSRIHKDTNSIILGLANRRRIWGLCEQIAESYVALKETKNSQTDSSLLKDAVSDKMIKVGQLEGFKFEMSKLALFDEIEDVGSRDSTLQVHWSREGCLLGFGVKTATATRHLGASNRMAARTDSVAIPQGDWLRGFVFITSGGVEYTYLCENDIGRVVVGVELIFEHGNSVLLGKSEGDRRIAQVAEGQLLVGLLAEWTLGGGIVRLSLLRHAKEKPPSSDSSKNASIRTDESLGSVLWKHSLPPPQLNITKPLIGYWSTDFSVELNPHEAAVFGQNETELAALTTISIDAQFGGIELRYTDGTIKSYGPQPWAMKTFAIDGPGGERVTAVFMDVKTHPNGLRLLTNRRRQLTVGPNLAPGSNLIRSSATEAICGLFCGWGNEETKGKARMDSLGVFKLAGSYETENDEEELGPRDQAGLWWEPEAPPSSWREDGLVYGQHEQQTRWRRIETKPAEYDVACWLDLTRRVDTIRVTFTHGDLKQAENGMSLVSITLEYTDGSRESAGPDGFEGYTKACYEKKIEDEKNAEENADGDEDGDEDEEEEEENVDGDGDEDEDGGDDEDENEEDNDDENEDENSDENEDEEDDENEDEDEEDEEDDSKTSFPFCWCHYGFSDKQELAQAPHYRHEEFAVGGEYIQAVHLWTGPWLKGIQFVSARGAQGPRWGVCEGEPATIQFGEAAVGLKIGMADNERATTYADRIVASVQALVRATSTR